MADKKKYKRRTTTTDKDGKTTTTITRRNGTVKSRTMTGGGKEYSKTNFGMKDEADKRGKRYRSYKEEQAAGQTTTMLSMNAYDKNKSKEENSKNIEKAIDDNGLNKTGGKNPVIISGNKYKKRMSEKELKGKTNRRIYELKEGKRIAEKATKRYNQNEAKYDSDTKTSSSTKYRRNGDVKSGTSKRRDGSAYSTKFRRNGNVKSRTSKRKDGSVYSTKFRRNGDLKKTSTNMNTRKYKRRK